MEIALGWDNVQAVTQDKVLMKPGVHLPVRVETVLVDLTVQVMESVFGVNWAPMVIVQAPLRRRQDDHFDVKRPKLALRLDKTMSRTHVENVLVDFMFLLTELVLMIV